MQYRNEVITTGRKRKDKHDRDILIPQTLIPTIEDLTGDEALKLLRSMFDYVQQDIQPDMSLFPRLQLLWKIIQKELDINGDNYQAKCDEQKARAESRYNKAAEEQPQNTEVHDSVPSAPQCTEVHHGTPSAPSVPNINLNINSNIKGNKEIYTDTMTGTVVSIPLSDGQVFCISETDIAEYRKQYPKLDIEAILKNYSDWLNLPENASARPSTADAKDRIQKKLRQSANRKSTPTVNAKDTNDDAWNVYEEI